MDDRRRRAGDRQGSDPARLPGCGEPDLHGDDFCHECGHAFEHFGVVSVDIEAAEHGAPCPICAAGELVSLEYGRTQCDACGYTLRDEG